MMERETIHSAAVEENEDRRREEMILRLRMSDIKRKLLVLSGKGGVGKSTVAANLATALADAGKKVGLLDVDIHGPSIPQILGLQGQQVTGNSLSLFPVQATENLSVISIAFLLRENTEAVVWRGPMKYKAIRQFLTDVAWGNLDYLIVDSPPGTGDEPLSVAQLVGSPAAAVIVTTPQDVAISDVRRCITFCRSLMLPVAGIIENMSGFACPRCGEIIDLFKSVGGRTLAGEMNVPFLGKIPFEPSVVISGDIGEPFSRHQALSPVAKSFTEIVRKITENVA